MSRKSRVVSVVSALPFIPFAGWWATWVGLTAAAPPPRRVKPSTTIIPSGLKLDVVIPAHNEESTLPALIASLQRQSIPSILGTVLVVADHCTDNTAIVASNLGAEVLERTSGDNGKPLALRDGFAMLADRSTRGEALVVIDGDCVCGPDFLERIAYRIVEGAEAVQGAYTIADAVTSPVRRILSSSFALRNVVRASGANRLGIPVGLFGSGMAFRYEVLKHFSFTDVRSTSSVDRRPAGTDVTMWFDLLQADVTPVFAEGAEVIAPAPTDDHTLKTQRLRWERAQANTRRRGLRMLWSAIRRRNVRQVIGLVDWSAPPLVPSVKKFSLMSGLLLAAMAAFRLPLSVLRTPFIAGVMLTGYVTVGFAKLHGLSDTRKVFSSIPTFLVWKMRLYRDRQHQSPVDVRESQALEAG